MPGRRHLRSVLRELAADHDIDDLRLCLIDKVILSYTAENGGTSAAREIPANYWASLTRVEFKRWVLRGAKPRIAAWLEKPALKVARDAVKLRDLANIDEQIFTALAEGEQLLTMWQQCKAERASELKLAAMSEAERSAYWESDDSDPVDDDLEEEFWEQLNQAVTQRTNDLMTQGADFAPYVSVVDHPAIDAHLLKHSPQVDTLINDSEGNRSSRPPRKRDSAKDAVIRTKILGVLSAAKTIGKGKPHDVIAKELVRTKKDYGFGVETIRKILRGSYPPQKRFGLPGLE